MRASGVNGHRFFFPGLEPVERQGVLTDVSVDKKLHTGPYVADLIECRKRNSDFVSDTIHIHNQPVRLFAEQSAGKMGNHGQVLENSGLATAAVIDSRDGA